MPISFSGGSACGTIRYECSAKPVTSINYYCRDCQRGSGSAYASALVVPTSALRLLKGEPKYHTVIADSGHHVSRGFCANCGSPLLGKITEEPDIIVVQAASLDDTSWHRSMVDFFTASAQPWDHMNPALPKEPTP